MLQNSGRILGGKIPSSFFLIADTVTIGPDLAALLSETVESWFWVQAHGVTTPDWVELPRNAL